MGEETVSKNFIEQIIEKDLAEGKYDTICTRFPPEPNGYLHIGHAKAILLNYGLAQKYHGKFNMRFDDTNPTKERVEFVESIKADIKWLGADWEDRLFFASNYFDQMYEAAVKLIKKGKAYVSDLSADEIREYRGTLTEPGKEDPAGSGGPGTAVYGRCPANFTGGPVCRQRTLKNRRKYGKIYVFPERKPEFFGPGTGI